MRFRPYQEGDFVFTHEEPVWRERSNYIIHAFVGDTDYEQLFTKKIKPGLVELCCIPFFAYGMALGDFLEVDDKNLIQKVAQRNGRFTFRIDLKVEHIPSRIMIGNKFFDSGWLVEGTGDDLISLDAPDEVEAQKIHDFLTEMVHAGYLEYEEGTAYEYGKEYDE